MNIGEMQPGTAWALFASVAIVVAGSVSIIAILASRYKRLKVSKDGVSVSEDDEKRATEQNRIPYQPEEIAAFAALLAPMLRDALGHDCVRGEVIGQLVDGHGLLIDAGVATLGHLVGQGVNGGVKKAYDELTAHCDSYNAFLREKAIG